MKFKLTLLIFLFGILQLQGQQGCDLPYSVTPTPTDCGQDNGTVSITIGSLPPFFGSVNPGPGVPVSTFFSNPIVFTGLGAGTHSFSITTQEGCVISDTFVIEENNTLAVAGVYHAGCTPDATVVVQLSGGTGDYHGPAEATQFVTGFFRFTGLSSGPKSYIFSDDAGCTVVASFTVADELESFAVVTGCAPNANALVFISGGTPDYSGPGELFFESFFVIGDLEAGSYTETYSDALGCTVDVSFEVEPGLELEEILTGDYKVCQNAGMGWAYIDIGNGEGPITAAIDGQIVQSSPDGLFLFQNLIPGEYSIDFTDSNGCELTVDFIIEGEACCNFVIDVTESHEDVDEEGDYTNTVESHIDGQIEVCFAAQCVPDELTITINDDVIFSEIMGSGSCDGEITGGIADTCFTFCVEAFDIVVFSVDGDLCRYTDCGEDPTAWNLHVDCEDVECIDNDFSSGDYTSLREAPSNTEGELYREELRNNSQESIMIVPNPVYNSLTLTNSDDHVQYETARVFDSVGKLILTKKISSLDEFQMDTNSLPHGIYLLELENNTGIKITKKFTKVE